MAPAEGEGGAELVRLVVTGAGGQLGSDVLALAGHDERVAAVQGLSRRELDVTDRTSVRAVLTDQAAANGSLVVINCAAWTDVDGAEADEHGAYAINAAAPAHLAAACADIGARLIHVSTDYVFAGDAHDPYEVDDAPAPKTAYGRTKLAGEEAVRVLHPDDSYVVRTAWVYGATGANFVKTMAKLEQQRETLTVVDDQRGAPTWSKHLAAGLIELSVNSAIPPGILHATGAGDTTWCGFARAIFAELGADPARVLPCTTADFPRPAPRPAYSVLSPTSWNDAGLTPLPPWRDALQAAFLEARAAFTGE